MNDIRATVVDAVNMLVRARLASKRADAVVFIEVDDVFIHADKATPDQWEAAQVRLAAKMLDGVEALIDEMARFHISRTHHTARRSPNLFALPPCE